MRDDLKKGSDLQRKVTYLPDTHRLLPQSPDAERGVLSCFLLAPQEVGDMCQEKDIQTAHFFIPSHQDIYSTLLALHAARQPIDFITLTQILRDQGKLDQCGGAAFVTELFTFLPTAANAAYYVEILKEKFVLREMIKLCTEFAARGYDDQDEVPELLEAFQSKAVELGGDSSEALALRLVTNAEIIERLCVVEERYKQRGRIAGLTTGIHDLDRMIDGLKGKHVYTIAGRPAMGKSAFGENIWEHVCLNVIEETGRPAAYFSLEMPREQVIDRALLGRARVNLQRLRDGFMSEADFASLQASAAAMAKGKMLIDDTPGLTIAQFRARARRAVLKLKACLIVVDMVQLMKGSTKRASENRVLELTEIMQGVTETAKQLDTPIVLLAQLGRGAEDRPGSIPTMSDLKECGAIEEFSNFVGLLFRPGYYAKTDAKRAEIAEKYNVPIEDVDTIAKLIVAKHRNGPVGDIELRFHGKFTRFEGVTKKLFSNNAEDRQQLN